MVTIVNGTNGKTYNVHDKAGCNYLLEDANNGQFIIAHGLRNPAEGWAAGKYFGWGEDAKRKAAAVFMRYTIPGSFGY